MDKEKKKEPEAYYYCKYGGIMPLCSDCQRNHSNSDFTTDEIKTWYAPFHTSKYCVSYEPIMKYNSKIDYILQRIGNFLFS